MKFDVYLTKFGKVHKTPRQGLISNYWTKYTTVFSFHLPHHINYIHHKSSHFTFHSSYSNKAGGGCDQRHTALNFPVITGY